MSTTSQPIATETTAAETTATSEGVKSHAADQAGGDVVYSSDGLEPLPVVRPPQVVLQDQDDNALFSNDLLDTTSSIYNVQQSYDQLFGSRNALQETPSERLQRLQDEVTAVEHELQADAAIQETCRKLQARLVATAGAATAAPRMWEDLASNSVASSDLEARLVRVEMVVDKNLVGNDSTTTSSRSSSSTAKSSDSFGSRLQRLETLVEAVDERALQKACAKAKVLRHDLEAATKARNKLTSSSTSGKSSSSSSADAATIAALHTAWLETQSVSSQLPALVERLAKLAALHADAATWASRLTSVEQAVQMTTTQVKSVTTAVDQLQTQWKEQAAQLQTTLQGLDERLEKLQ